LFSQIFIEWTHEDERLTNNPNQDSSRTQEDALHPQAFDSSSSANQSNEKLLMILNMNSGLAPYSHEFQRSSLDPQILSGFISAMTSFMGLVTGKQQSSWKTVFGSDSVILVVAGKWTYGVLAVTRETNEARSMLIRVTSEFEDCFEVFKNSDGIEGSAFREFDQFARMVFVDERVTSRTLVMKRPELRTLTSLFDLPSTTYTMSKMLFNYRAELSVQEIAEFQSLPIEEVVEHVSNAFWKKAVYLKFVPADDDLLILSEGASTILFHKSNPLSLADKSVKVIALFDGRTKLLDFMKNLNHIEKKTLLDDLGNLVNRGYIQRISEEHRLILQNECILSALLSKGSLLVGRKRIIVLFDIISEDGRTQHPWINRIMITDGMQSYCIFEHNSNLDILNDIIDTLEYFIEELKQRFSRLLGRHTLDRLFHGIKTSCIKSWFPHRSDVGA